VYVLRGLIFLSAVAMTTGCNEDGPVEPPVAPPVNTEPGSTGKCVPFAAGPNIDTCLTSEPQTTATALEGRTPDVSLPFAVDLRAPLDGCLEVHDQGRCAWQVPHAVTASMEARLCQGQSREPYARISEPHLWSWGSGDAAITDCQSGWLASGALEAVKKGTRAGGWLVGASAWPYADAAATMEAARPGPATLLADGLYGNNRGHVLQVPGHDVTALKVALSRNDTVVYAVPVHKDSGWVCTSTSGDGCRAPAAPSPAPADDCRCSCADAGSGCVECASEPHCVLGYHSLLVVGYDDTDDGTIEVLNSWSAEWGDGGYGKLSYEFITKHGLGGDYANAIDTKCTPDCTNKLCGSDGCYGSCGGCPPLEACSAAFTCESAIPGVPTGVNQFLDLADFDAILQTGMQIHTGLSPPQIAGTYIISSPQITFDDQGANLPIIPYEWSFRNQDLDGTLLVDFRSQDGSDRATGVGGFVSGANNCFSVFVAFEGSIRGCDYITPNIVTGCLEANGIREWTLGFLMKSKVGSTCNQLVPVGHRRVVRERDGFAERR